MKAIHCFARAIIFLVAYSSCTKFVLDETEKDIQVIEEVIENLKEVVPPLLPDENSAKPYAEENIIFENLTMQIKLNTFV